MFKKSLSAILLMMAFTFCQRKQVPQQPGEGTALFTAEDHTAENLFSTNIEGPAVNAAGELFVVNYLRDGTVGKVHPDGRVELYVELSEASTGNSIQFRSNGNMLIADFRGHNILEVDARTKALSVYCHDSRFNQPNDLCIHSSGIVYASDPDWKNSKGQVWKIGTDLKAVLFSPDMGTTNGICLSPDEKILYVNESVQRKIWALELDAAGNLLNKRLFVTVDDHGFDGMKCDSVGNLYVTRYGKGTIAVFNPEGQQIREISLKGKKVSNITFGGSDYRTAFVTLQDRKGIERFRVDIPGKK